MAAVALFEKFIEYKRKQVEPQTLEKYFGLQSHLRRFFRQRTAIAITDEDAFGFREWAECIARPHRASFANECFVARLSAAHNAAMFASPMR